MLSLLALAFYLIICTSKATTFSVTDSISNQNIIITLTIDTDTDIVNITLSGPADRWFGIGFGSTTMTNTYSIITDNGQGTNKITERKLGQASAGNILSSTINIQKDETINNLRTITILRNRTITTSNDYYTFPNTQSDINILWAFSNTISNTFAYHGPFSAGTHDTHILPLSENIPPTAPVTTLPSPTISFNICNDKRCKYIILITFEILYSFIDDTNVDNFGFKTVIISSMENILNEWIPNKNNIKISLTLSISNAYPQINIDATIGVQNDNIYDDIQNAYEHNDIINEINSNLPNDVNIIYISAGFSIQNEIISEFSIINSTVIDEDKNEHTGLFAFINFDFSHYRLYDWIVFCGCIIFILLCCFCCCFCCCWCYEQRRISKIPDSTLNASTGTSRISIFRRENPMKKTEIKQQDSLFEYKNNQPSPDERYENEPQNVHIYKSNYAASPMRHEWNNAFNAAANAKLHVVGTPEDDDDTIGGTQRTVAASVAMSTVSFGKDLKIDNVQAKLIPEDNEQEEYLDYEQELEQDNNGGGGPPNVSGSMVNRMNNANNFRNEAYV